MKLLCLFAAACMHHQPPHRPIANCESDHDAGQPGEFRTGHAFNARRVDELVAGESTVADARCALGPWTTVTTDGDGSSAILWSSGSATRTASGIDSHVQMMTLAFDSAGIFIRVLSTTSM